ncbi:MAG: Gldg family protein [Alphaproteobacteria bacterium]|nr:Gldg family protein [Alphaproteobacteria bacterium]
MFKPFLSLFKKEFSSFFASNIIYFLIVLYVFLSMISTFYFGAYFQTESTGLQSFFFAQSYLLMMIVPAVTMRIWADEKKSGTYEITMTFPVSFAAHVYAKFLATFSVLFVMILATIPFWFYANFVMNIDNLVVLSSYFGLFLLALVLCAIGCFVSACTSSVIFAYLFSVFISWFVMNFDFNLLLPPLALVSQEVYLLLQGSLSPSSHLGNFFSAYVSFDDFIFFFTYVVLFLAVNKFVLENKNAKESYWNFIYFILMFLVFIFINLSSALVFSAQRADLTTDKRYTYSPAAREIVSDLPSRTEIKLYISEDLPQYAQENAQYMSFIINRFKNLEKLSDGKIKVSIRAVKTHSLNEREAKENGLLSFISPNGEATLYFGAVFADYSGKTAIIPRFIQERKAFLESDVSRILYNFAHPKKKIGWVDASGSDEFSDVKDLLAQDYEVTEINYRTMQILAPLDAVVVANFQDASNGLVYALEQYLFRGGKLLLFADNMNENQQILKDVSVYSAAFLKNINLSFDNLNVVVDETLAKPLMIEDLKNNKRMIDDVLDLKLTAQNINQENEITRGLSNLNFISPALISETKENATLQTTVLLKTSETAGTINAAIAKAVVKEYVSANYVKENKQYNLAYLVQGTTASIFEDSLLGANNPHQAKLARFMEVSLKPFSLIVVADTGVLQLKNYGIKGEGFDHALLIEPNDNYRLLTRSLDYLVENNQLLAVNNRLPIQNDENLYMKVLAKQKSIYSQKIEEIRSKTYENEIKINLLKKDESEISLLKVKDVEILNQENTTLKEEMKKLEYQLDSAVENRINLFVLGWSVIYPLSIIFLLFLFMKMYYIIRRRKIKEFFDEN